MARKSDALVGAHEPTVLNLTLARPGRIEGTVIDDPSDAALEGVEVRLLSPQGDRLATCLTDDQGQYLFDAVRAGDYAVMVVAPMGYLVNEPPAHILLAPRQVAEAHFTLRPGGVVQGRVVDEHTGEPLGGVAVMLLASDGRELRRATTTDTGHYEFVNLPEDRYQVEIAPDAADA